MKVESLETICHFRSKFANQVVSSQEAALAIREILVGQKFGVTKNEEIVGGQNRLGFLKQNIRDDYLISIQPQ